jgi:membrane-anchored mycosin MYCP
MALLSLLTSVLSIGLAVTRPGVASAVAAACKDAPKGSSQIQQEPWQQTWFDAPAKIWPFSTGAGMTVAVIDAGVDPNNMQLMGKVLNGYDFVRNTDQGDVDCVPHGTAEAGIIVASQEPNIGFYGLAPEAKILPVRVAKEAVTNDQSKPLDPTKLAAGITYAADHGANVIDCAVVTYQDNPAVKAAVKQAISKGVVVVAMVGDSHQMQRDGIGPTTPSLTPYPASYKDVIGVGAVDSNGRRVDTSQIGFYTDLVAPGGDVESDAIGGQDTYNGTGVASAFVAATAALLLSEHGSPYVDLTGAARVRALTKQLLGTASPELSTEDSMAYGAGLVDPFRALTEKPSSRGPVALPAHTAPPPPPPNPAKQAALKARRHTNHRAAQLAEAVGGGTLLLLGLVIVVPRGRDRRWRPVRQRVSPAPVDDAPEFVSGEKLFTHPSPRN